jgi:hypothetical protein
MHHAFPRPIRVPAVVKILGVENGSLRVYREHEGVLLVQIGIKYEAEQI